jgi:hypothetical protein
MSWREKFNIWKELNAWSILWILVSLAAIGGVFAIYCKYAS